MVLRAEGNKASARLEGVLIFSFSHHHHISELFNTPEGSAVRKALWYAAPRAIHSVPSEPTNTAAAVRISSHTISAGLLQPVKPRLDTLPFQLTSGFTSSEHLVSNRPEDGYFSSGKKFLQISETPRACAATPSSTFPDVQLAFSAVPEEQARNTAHRNSLQKLILVFLIKLQ